MAEVKAVQRRAADHDIHIKMESGETADIAASGEEARSSFGVHSYTPS
jgi:hypothetical protein